MFPIKPHMWLFLASPFMGAATANDLPIVNLGYQLHQAIAFNSTGRYYNFTNIRYAEPPLGSLRFAAPVPPGNHSQEVFNGAGFGNICPQASQCWSAVQTEFLETTLAGSSFDFETAYKRQYANNSCSKPIPASERDPNESEDCLFLDVFVPETIFASQPGSATKGGAPVLVYLQDGAFVEGSKSGQNPAGLLEEARENGSSGIIYVGLNYRLGVFGWLSGSKFESSGGLPNAGLYDQRLALQWVQQNIHLFGGDPNRVTVMGESSGGSSIIMQLIAYGHSTQPPFQQVITQSAAWEPGTKPAEIEEELLDTFLDLLNVSSLAEARELPSQELIDANYVLVASRPYGGLFIGPAVDGTFIPDDPKRLLLQRKIHPGVQVLTTYEADEGYGIAPVNITDDASFSRYVDLELKTANSSVRSYVKNVLYPSVFNGSMPYTTQHERASVFWSELITSCNARYLHGAVQSPGYATEYSVPPASHLSDTTSIFYNGPVADSGINTTVAEVMQKQIVQFVKTGNPSSRTNSSEKVPVYDGRVVFGMGSSSIGVQQDITDNDRCAYWQNAPYLS